MSAVAVALIAIGALLIYSALTKQALFIGPDARVPKILRGEK